MGEKECKKVVPPNCQYEYDCVDGKVLRRRVCLWICKLGERTWQEWRPEGNWEDTGDPC